ncbi:MAG: class II aldolase/adducin family protein [Bacteroidota bacterium]|nr:class II aldolase/adducin family protein [Bacteroidota bacterium]
MRNEGVIKFKCQQKKTQPEIPDSILSDLNLWRERLLQLGFIGINSEGVGYGNISVRYKSGFVISGSATGGILHLDVGHYAFVNQWNIELNALSCIGLVPASSESLSHAAVYDAGGERISAVIHVHHPELWRVLSEQSVGDFLESPFIEHCTVPSTPMEAEYGTPSMAKAIIDIVSDPKQAVKQILVMRGHEDGILVWGSDLDEAGKILLHWAKLLTEK